MTLKYLEYIYFCCLLQFVYSVRPNSDSHWHWWYQTMCGSIWRGSVPPSITRIIAESVFLHILLHNKFWWFSGNDYNTNIKKEVFLFWGWYMLCSWIRISSCPDDHGFVWVTWLILMKILFSELVRRLFLIFCFNLRLGY